MAILHDAHGPALPSLRTRLASERLVVRPPHTVDVAEYRHLLRKNETHLRPWSPQPAPGEDPTSLLHVSALITRQRRDWRRGHQYVFFLLLRPIREGTLPSGAEHGRNGTADGSGGAPACEGENGERTLREKIVGRIALGGLHRGAFQNAYLGYWIDGALQRQGLMTEALRLVLDFAFGEARLHRVQIAIMPKNTASLRVAEKMGFRREGYAERYLSIAGAWEDHALFAVTTEEWQARAG